MNPGAMLRNSSVFSYLRFYAPWHAFCACKRVLRKGELTLTRRTTSETTGVAIFLLVVTVSSLAVAGPNDKFFARSINMPVEFSLCEHLDDAILYENDVPISAMPAERTFQFTYYPDLGLLLPEQVRVEVAGKYKEDDEPFVTRLAVTIDDAAGTHAPSDKRPKLDIRLEPQTLVLACERYCKRLAPATHAPTER